MKTNTDELLDQLNVLIKEADDYFCAVVRRPVFVDDGATCSCLLSIQKGNNGGGWGLYVNFGNGIIPILQANIGQRLAAVDLMGRLKLAVDADIKDLDTKLPLAIQKLEEILA